MKRYVLEIDIIYDNNGEIKKIKRELDSQENAISLYNRAQTFFKIGNKKGLKDIFELDNKKFYFRSTPRLFKENVVREEYKP